MCYHEVDPGTEKEDISGKPREIQIKSAVLTNLPWLCKMLTLGIAGEMYMRTIGTTFITSEI